MAHLPGIRLLSPYGWSAGCVIYVVLVRCRSRRLRLPVSLSGNVWLGDGSGRFDFTASGIDIICSNAYCAKKMNWRLHCWHWPLYSNLSRRTGFAIPLAQQWPLAINGMYGRRWVPLVLFVRCMRSADGCSLFLSVEGRLPVDLFWEPTVQVESFESSLPGWPSGRPQTCSMLYLWLSQCYHSRSVLVSLLVPRY